MKRIKTLVIATAACLFATGCYIVCPAAPDDPSAGSQTHYYYLKFDLYYPDTGDGRWREDRKLWDDFEGVVTDQHWTENRMALTANPHETQIYTE